VGWSGKTKECVRSQVTKRNQTHRRRVEGP